MRTFLFALTILVVTAARSEEIQPRPVRVAATKFGSFFKGLFQKSEPAGAAPDVAATTSNPLDLSRFTKGQMSDAVKQALGQGLTNAITRLSQSGGFLTNESVRIEMPAALKRVEEGLRRYGQDGIADTFLNTLNTAAEKAVPLAAPIFQDALAKLSIEDAAKILSGPDNSATDYFKKTTSAELTKLLRAKVSETTEQVGLTSAYKQLISKLRFGSTFLNFNADDLDTYVTGQTLDGLFKVVAEEEVRIRKDPVARGTQLLQSVFGSVLKQ